MEQIFRVNGIVSITDPAPMAADPVLGAQLLSTGNLGLGGADFGGA